MIRKVFLLQTRGSTALPNVCKKTVQSVEICGVLAYKISCKQHQSVFMIA